VAKLVKSHDILDGDAEILSQALPATSSSSDMDALNNDTALGVIEDAWSLWNHAPGWEPNDRLYSPQHLQKGEVVQMPAGTSAYVWNEGRWQQYHFPRPGRLRGDILWSPAEPISDKKLLDEHRVERILLGVTACLTATSCPYVFAELLGAPQVIMTSIAVLGGTGMAGIFAWSWKKWPITIDAIAPCGPAAVRASRSKILGYRKSDLGKKAQPEFDAEIAISLRDYHAQRERLTVLGVPGHSMIDHTAAMLDDLAQRLQSVSHNAELRETFLDLVDRAEAEVVRIIERKEAREVEALEGDMKALITQIERHPA
jgi:hypothetical protein